MKAALYTEGTHIVSSFVATSSICQGQQVEPLWSALYEKGIHIKYAYTSFKWTSGANDTAYVYVVIVGFSHDSSSVCKLFTSDSCKLVSHINPYLVDGDDILIETRNIPLCNAIPQACGNSPLTASDFRIRRNTPYPEPIRRIHPSLPETFHTYSPADHPGSPASASA